MPSSLATNDAAHGSIVCSCAPSGTDDLKPRSRNGPSRCRAAHAVQRHHTSRPWISGGGVRILSLSCSRVEDFVTPGCLQPRVQVLLEPHAARRLRSVVVNALVTALVVLA